ncbi:unnamed protein product [Somion occarium]|uniref:G domain-containing protein n=1 Tax=Somion occarium TaxID=3059160 RepID=A0ABP1EB28_9APHY
MHSIIRPSTTMFGTSKDVAKSLPAHVAVMGCTGAGKTTFINLASNSDLRVGVGLESCTDAIQMSKTFILDDMEVTLVDTPGFDDTSKSDAEILNIVCDFLSSEYHHGRRLHGVIYLHRISDNRMAGSAMRNLRFFRQLCGDDALTNCAVVTSMWDSVSPQVGAEREEELKSKENFFKPILDSGATLFRHDNTIESTHQIIRPLIHKAPIALAIQRELVDEGKRVFETSAGNTLLGEIAALEKKHQEELQRLEVEMAEVMEQHDEETQREIEEAKQELLETQHRLEQERERILNATSTAKRQTKSNSFFHFLRLFFRPFWCCIRNPTRKEDHDIV